MATKRTTTTSSELAIEAVHSSSLTVHVLGVSPILFNNVSEKARRELLLPKGRKTAADKAANLKHDPMAEYVASSYRSVSNHQPTRLLMKAAAFKRAMMTAALETPGAKRTQIARLCWVDGEYVPIWGLPCLRMDVVRSADMNRTPDVHTWCAVKQWATRLTVRYTEPALNQRTIATLLANAGIIAGIGDGRQEKGILDFGRYELVGADDERYLDVIKHGREEQDQLLAEPEFYDGETENLYSWYTAEIKRRGLRVA